MSANRHRPPTRPGSHRRKATDPPLEPQESAEFAGLRYVSDRRAGIVRKRSGRGFAFYDRDGRLIRDEGELERIRALVIPPAWTDVWICPSARGHLQAVGRDALGRKQYRYHTRYREIRDQTKYGRLEAFAHALPSIRRRVRRDLARPGLPKEKVVAAVVRLLEATLIRIGNDEYAKQNRSFGLTTLRDRHVDISRGEIRFKFQGKSGQMHEISLADKRLARIVKKCRELPGYHLFQYMAEDGSKASLDSDDVNAYLRQIAGREFTAKDFRTWFGTIIAARALIGIGPANSLTQTKKNIVAGVTIVAQRLGNRPATCRKYYIHPAILEAYSDGSLFSAMEPDGTACIAKAGLSREERCVLTLIQRQNGKRVTRKAA